MKLTSQEEYGLRCLLRLAREGESLTIPKISQKEGISNFYVAKLMRILRRGGLVKGRHRGSICPRQNHRRCCEVVLAVALTALGSSSPAPTQATQCAKMTPPQSCLYRAGRSVSAYGYLKPLLHLVPWGCEQAKLQSPAAREKRVAGGMVGWQTIEVPPGAALAQR